eukprot:scaffold160262_cov20-Tisochrysis_lutea.AAC.1
MPPFAPPPPPHTHTHNRAPAARPQAYSAPRTAHAEAQQKPWALEAKAPPGHPEGTPQSLRRSWWQRSVQGVAEVAVQHAPSRGASLLVVKSQSVQVRGVVQRAS